jgi:hypothetical protein
MAFERRLESGGAYNGKISYLTAWRDELHDLPSTQNTVSLERLQFIGYILWKSFPACVCFELLQGTKSLWSVAYVRKPLCAINFSQDICGIKKQVMCNSQLTLRQIHQIGTLLPHIISGLSESCLLN